MNNQNSNQQLALFSIGGLIDPGLNRVFAPKELPGKNGPAGMEVKLISRKAMAEAFNLKGKTNKDALDAEILKVRDEACRMVKGEIAQLPAEYTLKKAANRTLSNGNHQITVIFEKIKRQVGPKPEDMAKALGLTVEEINQLIAEREKQETVKEIEGESSVQA